MTRKTNKKIKEIVEIDKEIKILNMKKQELYKGFGKSLDYKDFRVGYSQFIKYKPSQDFRKRVTELLKDRPMFIKEVATMLSLAPKTAYAYLLEMETEGTVIKKRFGNFMYYGLTKNAQKSTTTSKKKSGHNSGLKKSASHFTSA